MVSAALFTARTEDLHLSAKGARWLFGLGSLFILAANAVVTAADLGALWVAMEATTLVTAPLILLQGVRRSIEAAWKYIILCGVGIAFALLGTVFMLAATGNSVGGLGIAELTAHAPMLKRSLLNASFVFFLLGYGTKAGLFPVHNWLPDAHSEAPAPASALLSGALLNCAMVALWRVSGIVSASHSQNLLTALLVPMGAITVLAAGIMLVRQRNLKRMWAYSSIENMGILAVAVGLQAAPIFALHALAHSLAKSAAFLLSGAVSKEFGTLSLRKISGVMRRTPVLGFALLAAGGAAVGAPPFGSFISEWMLLSATFDGRRWGAAIALVVGLTLGCVAIAIHLGRVVFGKELPKVEGSTPTPSIMPAVLLLGLSVVGFAAVSPGVVVFLSRALQQGAHP
jgi:hydrogenase-4 component F